MKKKLIGLWLSLGTLCVAGEVPVPQGFSGFSIDETLIKGSKFWIWTNDKELLIDLNSDGDYLDKGERVKLVEFGKGYFRHSGEIMLQKGSLRVSGTRILLKEAKERIKSGRPARFDHSVVAGKKDRVVYQPYYTIRNQKGDAGIRYGDYCLPSVEKKVAVSYVPSFELAMGPCPISEPYHPWGLSRSRGSEIRFSIGNMGVGGQMGSGFLATYYHDDLKDDCNPKVIIGKGEAPEGKEPWFKMSHC